MAALECLDLGIMWQQWANKRHSLKSRINTLCSIKNDIYIKNDKFLI